jgi:putative ABC transport system substrate-binding protein
MRRRAFLSLLAAAAAVRPPATAQAQQAGKLPTVGIFSSASPAAWAPWTAALVQRLRELGWVEGRTVAIEYRWTQGRTERVAEIAAELVRLKPDVIVSAGTNVPALRQAAPAIPIVFAIGRDPVGEGLVASLARPGGNVTGLSTQVTDLAGKRLGLLREIAPGIRRIAVLTEPDDPGSAREGSEAKAAAQTLGLEVTALGLRSPDQDIATAFEALKGRVDALYVGTGGLTTLRQSHIFRLALAARLPAIGGQRPYARAGALISYGPDYSDLFRRAGDYIDRILRGTKPGDIPVEQPTKFELTINLKTAKALGIEIPSKLLFTADEVIE